jgi:CRP-like cAMP-binding protein
MNLQEEVAMLRRIPLFAHIDPAKLKLLAFTSERLAYEAGQIMFHQGGDSDAAFVILSGTADILTDSPQGPVSVAKLERNAIVGEVAILCGMPRTATVKALTRLETLRIKKDVFLSLLKEFPELSIEMMKVLASRLAKTTAELTDARNKLKAAGVN